MRGMRIRVLLAVVALCVAVPVGFAQQSFSEEGKRKVRLKVTPAYPELARRMNIAGKVKLEVVITPEGQVRTSRVVGGHPLLVKAAQDAVKEWKFVPGAQETTQIVEFDFNGSAG